MLSRVLLFFVGLILAAPLGAESIVPWQPGHMPPLSSLPKPVAVVYFTYPYPGEEQHALSIQHMVKQAKTDFGLTVEEHALPDEKNLAETITRLTEEDIGLIIIVAPHDLPALMKIPSLYPDVRFSIIDVHELIYLANVHTMIFKEEEGAFMMGVLAALTSQKGAVACIANEDNAMTRRLAEAFRQGARYARPHIETGLYLGKGAKPLDDEADIVFLLDEEFLPTALRKARQRKQRLMLFDHDLTGEYPDSMLTSLIKRYDLAIYTTLKHYRHDHWKPGNQTIGVGEGGYVDYVLNANNKEFIPMQVVEQVEKTKDLIAQSIIGVNGR